MNSISNLPLISIVIPNHNGSRYLKNCLQSLRSQSYNRMEIVVVDNASGDDSALITREIAPRAVLLEENQNLGFAGGVNAGIRASSGDWIAVLNNDTEMAPDWLDECARAIQNHPEASFFACRILDIADHSTIYSAGDCYLRAGIGYRRGQQQPDRAEFRQKCEIFSVSGCAGLYRKSVLDDMNGFDERFFAYLEDVDLGLRLQAAGYRGYYIPTATVYHHGAATSGGEFSPLAVRLRTRNSLLLLMKSLPGMIVLRCLPMILLAQLSWLLRVIRHKQMMSYAKGMAEAIAAAPAMLKDRGKMRHHWRAAQKELWHSILKSESMVRTEFATSQAAPVSIFLRWYFRLF